jgi:hypothetical protein
MFQKSVVVVKMQHLNLLLLEKSAKEVEAILEPKRRLFALVGIEKVVFIDAEENVETIKY